MSILDVPGVSKAYVDAATIISSATLGTVNIYATTAAGITATNATTNKYFSVPSAVGSEYLILYLNTAGTAVEMQRYPSATLVTGLSASVGYLAIRTGVNLYNKAANVSGWSLSATTGAAANSGPNWNMSDYIPATAGSTYYFASGATYAAGNSVYVFYDANKTIIAGAFGNAASAVAPSGAAYLRVSRNDANFQYWLVAKDALPVSFIAYRQEVNGDSSATPLVINKPVIAEAIANSATEISASIKVNTLAIRIGLNLYNDVTRLVGWSLSPTTGAISNSGGNWFTSDYINVSVGGTYYFAAGATYTAGNSIYVFYDAFKAIIAGAYGNAATAVAPAGAVYMRISRNDPAHQYVLAAKDALPNSFVAFRYEVNGDDSAAALVIKKPVIAEAISNSATEIAAALKTQTGIIAAAQTDFLELSTNLFDPTLRAVDTSISLSTGVASTTTGWWASAYVPVTVGSTYWVTTQLSYSATLPLPRMTSQSISGAYYSPTKAYIAAFTSGTVAPAGAAYLRFSANAPDPVYLSYMLSEGAVVPVRFIPYKAVINAQKLALQAQRWWGKNHCALGDSITFQNLYAPKLLEVTGLIQTVNLGVSGQVLKTMADSLDSTNIANIDLITLLGGTNDYGHGSTTLGTAADDKTVNSIHGVMKYLFDKILTLKPTVRIVVFTPLNRGAYLSEPVPPAVNPNGLTIYNIGQAMMEECRLAGIPCFDLGGMCGINSYNLSAYTQDNLHPNQPGADIIGAAMGRFINQTA